MPLRTLLSMASADCIAQLTRARLPDGFDPDIQTSPDGKLQSYVTDPYRYDGSLPGKTIADGQSKFLAKECSPAHSWALVGYSGAAGSWLAVRAVAGRGWPANSRVALVTCAGSEFGATAGLGDSAHPAGEPQAPAVQLLREAGFEVSPIVIEGEPKLKLAEYAAANGISAIFLGHHDRGVVYRAFMGTVASAIIGRVSRSVEVARITGDAGSPSKVT